MRKAAAPTSLVASCLLAGVVGLATGHASLAEKIGKVSEPLVAGNEVSPAEQQSQALVALDMGGFSCSGVLLNSEWVIAAAHCFQNPDVKASEVKVTVNWPTKEKNRTGKELYILPKDLAILRVDTPFDAISVGYNMPVYTDTMSAGRGLKVYGKGIYALAKGEGDTATPSVRTTTNIAAADFQVTRVDGDHFWFGPSAKGGKFLPAGTAAVPPSSMPAAKRPGGHQLALHGYPGRGQAAEAGRWAGDVKMTSAATCRSVRCGRRSTRIPARRACRNYAWRAVGAVQLATGIYKCDPKTISGPRWTPNFDDHLNFCMHAKAADANFEDKERNRIAQECRIAAAMPQGTSALQVAPNADGFALSGSGYAVNSRVIIRSTDSAGFKKNITSNFSDPKGNFAATVATADVCTKPGTITFTAEDQDKPASAPVNATCQQVAAAPPPPPPPPPGDDAQPPKGGDQVAAPPPGQKFVTVKLSVDLYEEPGGQGHAKGTLEAGTPQVTLVEPCNDHWCHVKWPAGQGFVYSGPGYESLKLP